jgi:hypothetical protein
MSFAAHGISLMQVGGDEAYVSIQLLGADAYASANKG